jgi:hypothetical protein
MRARKVWGVVFIGCESMKEDKKEQFPYKIKDLIGNRNRKKGKC